MLREPMAAAGDKPDTSCLAFEAIEHAYQERGFTPADLVMDMADRASLDKDGGIWIHRAAKDELVRQIAEVEARKASGARLPLFGLPLAVKDNIDVAGMPTTAACPAFAYTPKRSAVAVELLVEAGAIVLGKTNLDQFATGLVGTRSPYGIPRNPFDGRYVSGGSSSGSAVSVARGMATVALGTDTAGSGRVPAAFNNIVGLKPSRGLISTTGVVPACRSLDCVSVFALTCADAWRVFEVARNFDPQDPYGRHHGSHPGGDSATLGLAFRFGVPDENHLEFLGDALAKASFERTLRILQAMGGIAVPVDLGPFREAAQLLYDGPWVAERLAAAGKMLADHPEALDATVREILRGATRVCAQDVFAGQSRLNLLKHRLGPIWRTLDVLVLPTAPTIYTIEQVQAEPVRLNTNLGYYTNFVNLLDLCALAVPAGFRADALPFGITLIAPHGHDARLATLGVRLHALTSQTVGVCGQAPSKLATIPTLSAQLDGILVAVVGAHLSGEPLNHQLLDAGSTYVRTARTAPCYRLYELPNTQPPKPGLVRVEAHGGAAIELEIWRMPSNEFGPFVSRIPSPLCIGTIELADGTPVHGFLCEDHAVHGARDISSFGGWRGFRRSPGLPG